MPRGDQNGARLHPERMPRGEKHGMAKLTESQVKEIRKIYRFGAYGKGAHSIALLFGLTKATVLRIVKRVIWKHV